MTPPPLPLADNKTPALTVGSSLTDPETGTTVTTSAKTASALSVNVTLGKTDFTPPTVTITYPTDGGTVPRNTYITISAQASDNVAVTKVEFAINGSLLCTDTTSPYSCLWKVPAKRGASYTLAATAYDGAGNKSTHTISVTAR